MSRFVLSCFTLVLSTNTVWAGFVTPQMGGGQISQGTVLMKHADISFFGNTINVHLDASVATPELRPLESPDEFDPNEPWGVLGTKAYNYQYGWNPSGFISLPPTAWIWIEQLSVSPGLEVYQRPPASPSYAPIFGTDGSPARWRWNGAMTHNAYAIQDPLLNLYEATYRVYIGDDVTGEPLAGYIADEVTFEFIATPVLHADFDDSGYVGELDYAQWAGDFGSNGDSDADDDGDSDGADFLAWQRELGAGTAPAFAAAIIPEPSAMVLLALGGVLVASGHIRQRA